jgi:hypothetical protein
MFSDCLVRGAIMMCAANPDSSMSFRLGLMNTW